MAFDTLTDRYQVPPGGWRYTQGETGLEIRGGDFFHLCQRVRVHRQLNKLPTGNLEKEIETQLCEKLSEAARHTFCRESKPKPVRRVDFADVKHFLATLVNLRKFVPKEEAERRAKICTDCPLNLSIAGCTSCRNLPALIFKVIGKRYTSLDRKLGGCEVCGCGLAAAVHIPLESFPTAPHYKFPDWCWHHERRAKEKAGGDQA